MNSDPHFKLCKFLVSVISGTSDFFGDKLFFSFLKKNILGEKKYIVKLTYLASFFFFLDKNFAKFSISKYWKIKNPGHGSLTIDGSFKE
jgi:hypothetical protein